MANLGKEMRNYCINMYGYGRMSNDALNMLDRVASELEPLENFEIVRETIKKLERTYDDFWSMGTEAQFTIMSGILLAKKRKENKITQTLSREMEEGEKSHNIAQALKKVFIDRLGFTETDFRHYYAEAIIDLFESAKNPDKIANQIIDNLINVFEVKTPISIQEAIRRFDGKNVQQQKECLFMSAQMLKER